MKERINNLTKYLDRLSRDTGWYIIIADYYGVLREFEGINSYLSYRKWHVNPYCMRIKQDKARHERCVEEQGEKRRNVKRRGEAGFEVCYCGVAEFSLPVFLGGVHAFTVTVTGFLAEKTDEEMLCMSKETGIDTCELAAMRQEHLEPVTDELCERLDCYIGMVGDMLYDVFRDAPLLRERDDGTSIQQRYVLLALDHIRKHYFEEITPKSVAARCNVSLSYLQHLFIEYTNEGVASAIRRQRMEHAAQLLLDTDDSVRSIAIACGYYDTDYFSVIFKRYYGTSPLKFRRGGFEKK